MASDHSVSAYVDFLFGGIRRIGVFMALLVSFGVTTASAQRFENDSIDELDDTPINPIARLRDRLRRGEATLEFEPAHGYLKSLLGALDIPVSSQTLVFSKTSLQHDRISPNTPRAIYFNDDVMIGFCFRGRVLEIATADERLGASFYTLDQTPRAKATPRRQTEACLLCHGSSANRGYSGHIVRSLFVDRKGDPDFSKPSFRTDHTSPLAQRWGGWYVTGTSGSQKHMGNIPFHETSKSDITEADGSNVVDLKDRFTTSYYLTPHSDIVALMVLEHQTGMLNRLARAGLETRSIVIEDRERNESLGKPIDERSEFAKSRIRNLCDDVVSYMLFRDETKLTDRIEGTSSFAADFATRGRRDSKGRSLRDFDLRSRLFLHPCSYLIESRAFDSLPIELKESIYQRLWEILNGRADGGDDPKIAPDERTAIVEILRATKSDLPSYWKSPRSEREEPRLRPTSERKISSGSYASAAPEFPESAGARSNERSTVRARTIKRQAK